MKKIPLSVLGIAAALAAGAANAGEAGRTVDFELKPTPRSCIRCRMYLPPAETWDGRLWGTGNGGPAGKIDEGTMNTVVRHFKGRTAVVNTDLGTADGRAVGNAEAWTDFAWRATHLMTVEAKRIVRERYGRDPSKCYFYGLSTGGGQGLHEAQRFPEDYDGVVSCVPAHGRMSLAALGLWCWRQAHDKDGRMLFTPEQTKALAKAGLDYWKGEAPRYSEAVAKKILAAAQESEPSLKDPELAKRVLATWKGPQFFGNRARLEGVSFGVDPWYRMNAGPFMFGFLPQMPKEKSWQDVDDRKFIDMIFRAGSLFNAENPDLGAFAKRGGKLIMFAGLADHIVPFATSVDYWERAAARAGGEESLSQFLRLYLIPMLRHGSDRSYTTLDDIVAWVEEGRRPGTLEALENGTLWKVKPYPEGVKRPLVTPTDPIFTKYSVEPPENADVYVLIGQSNMAGRGFLTPENVLPSPPNAWCLDKGDRVTPLLEPIQFDGAGVGASIGAEFGRRIAAAHPERKVLLVPSARGGTRIDQWDPARKTSLYHEALARVRTAQRYGAVRGVIWHQGESDGKADLAPAYADKFVGLVTALRRDLGNPDLPVVAGELGGFVGEPWGSHTNDTRALVAEVNRQLHAAAERLPHCAIVTSEGLGHKGDHLHFSTEAAREYGGRYAEAMQMLLRSDGRIRAVQLDLARQMETPAFVSNYIDRVSAWGVNTLQLYLEARASTSVFSLPEGRGYPKETLRGFVEHAAEKGVTVIPVVSLLGHAELFFKDGTIDALSEEASGGSRWGSKSKQTFCLSNPATRDFLERHVAELCEVFTGPYFHVGFDESWNMGFCPRCRPKSSPDGGDALFAEFVNWAHGVCARNGKRMMMWDDFFGFHPAALGKVPRDIVMQHWNYTPHISSRGARFNFGGHGRTDWLALYRELGFEAVTVNWYDTENVRTLADYDRRSATKGFVFGQWEDLQLQFHGGNLPRVLARVLLDLEPSKYQAEDAFAAAVRRLFPSLDEAGVLAATAILHSQPPRTMPWKVESATGFRRGAPAFADALAVEVLKASSLHPGTGAVDADPLCERALLDDIVLRGEAGLADEAIARAAPLLTDPRRTPEDVRAAKRALAAERPRLERVIARRQEQAGKWRPGCTPDRMTIYLRDGLKCIDGVLKRKEEPAPADEKRLELGLTLVDYYGRPKWTVSGRFSDGWRELAKGGWKPARGEWAAFSKYVTFRSAEMPAEVRVAYDGYGAASLRYLQIEDAAGVARPVKVLSSEGAVTGAENLLVDDMREAVFGVPDAIGQIRDTSNPPPTGTVVLEVRLGFAAAPWP